MRGWYKLCMAIEKTNYCHCFLCVIIYSVIQFFPLTLHVGVQRDVPVLYFRSGDLSTLVLIGYIVHCRSVVS